MSMQVEAVRVLPPIVLKDLGIDLQADSLHLRDDQVHLVTAYDSQTRERVCLAMLNHPFIGKHFADFLGTVAPRGIVGYNSVNGTVADFAMPAVALGTQQPRDQFQRRAFPRLHTLHTQDPDIGPTYQSFVAEHLPFWNQVTNNGRLNNLLWYMEPTMLYKDRSTLGRQLFSHWMRRSTENSLVLGEMDATLARYQEERFMDFVHRQKGYENAEPLRFETYKLAKDYLSQLSDEEQIAFSFTYALTSMDLLMSGRIWVDTMQRSISAGYKVRIEQVGEGSFFVKSEYSNERVNMRFLDDGSVAVEDPDGTVITIGVLRKSIFKELTGNRRFGDDRWRVRGYQFSEDVQEAGLYPVVAVAFAEEGRKRFLTQQEAREILDLSQIPHAANSDVAAGKALLVYVKPSIAKGWDKVMFLKHKRYAMPMDIGNAQVGVWVSLNSEKYPHATQLLADTNGLLQKLEDHMR